MVRSILLRIKSEGAWRGAAAARKPRPTPTESLEGLHPLCPPGKEVGAAATWASGTNGVLILAPLLLFS